MLMVGNMPSPSYHHCYFSTPLCRPLHPPPPPPTPPLRPPSKLLWASPPILSHRRSPNGASWIQNLSHTPPSALPFDLSPPPIDHDLLDTVTGFGAKLSEDGIVETFDNDDDALDAVENGVVVVDLSHFGRIRVSGEDRIQFLHNQSTANFECLQEGQGCDTVFVTPTARTIDIGHAWIMRNAVTLVVSPMTSGSITQMLRKYVFFADKVEIEDISKQTCLFVLAGARSNQVMMDLNLGDMVGQPHGTHKHYTVSRMPVTVAAGNIISEEGFSLLMSPAAAGSVWKTLLSQGAVPMGSKAWETFRVFQGRPAPGKELTDEYNVLEAGLWNSISMNKGCYKGQETISRLITYDGVKQRLWGIRLSSPVEPGTPIIVDAKKVGKLTSYAAGRNESEHFGLGYIKRKAASEGDTVNVGDNAVGTVVEVPFLARQCPPLSKSSNS
ncbi:putative transferase At1g60990, chloroplastic [Rhododendron vialii]|uniref:putative transferase At1g60990, chloroplastic n=1 Tax=Rhododendron vialii TaxID=182163 RepID=UPI00265D985B|nr:putative transferase At1g60990, chloroplastic [Rhododendron vialii]